MKIVNIDNKKSIDSIDNKKSTRKMKDEYGGTPVIEFVSPKPKSYTLIDVNNYEKSTHKGHSSNFKSSEFKDVVNNKKGFRHIMKKKKHLKIIKYILKKAIKYLYLVLMIKDIKEME